MNNLLRTVSAVLLVGVSVSAVSAEVRGAAPVPAPPNFSAQITPILVKRSDILEFKSLDNYSEPAFVSEFVKAGKLPPVKERLPKEPMVYKTANMPDGVGTYGDVMRHVIGGRPEGWNYIAGQSQGWGGIDIGLYECLTRTAPLFQVAPDDLIPLPNLAKGWDWSDDGYQLTMHLVEGAKWSDGDPFDAEDVMFYWDDHIMNKEISPLNGATQSTFGEGTTLEKIDDYTVKFTFKTVKPEQALFQMSYGNFCPGPSHIMKPHHPDYGGESYEAYQNAFPADFMGFPVMGAWVPVEYRPDDVIVLRRNPYYWKVDETGQQLPYMNELHYRLSTWGDRDIQAVAGTGDFSNLEQPENFVESLKKAADPDSPARLEFGPRIIGYTLYTNFSANGWGEPDERASAIRDLNRKQVFRQAISHALDRQRLGNSLVKGPFTAIYPGGLHSGTTFYDADSTTYFPYDLEMTKSLLAEAGLIDTDGNGIVNHPKDVLAGADLQVVLLANSSYQTDKNLAEGIVAMMEDAGIGVSLNLLDSNNSDSAKNAGKFDWNIVRNGSELITAIQATQSLAPTGPKAASHHFANDAGELDLMEFESEMVAIVNKFTDSRDGAERVQLMKNYQKVYTENLYGIGLTQFPGALIVNKRFSNIPKGTPINMFNWAEDSIMRERVFVASDAQQDYELHPDSLPGLPGGSGTMTVK